MSQVFAYSVELVQREGRWEVHRLLPAAPLANAGDAAHVATPATTTTAVFSSDATPTTAIPAPAPDVTQATGSDGDPTTSPTAP